MDTLPEFERLITHEMLTQACIKNSSDSWCSFKIEGYSVLGHKCPDRGVWEIHVHMRNTHIITFTVDIKEASAQQHEGGVVS